MVAVWSRRSRLQRLTRRPYTENLVATALRKMLLHFDQRDLNSCDRFFLATALPEFMLPQKATAFLLPVSTSSRITGANGISAMAAPSNGAPTPQR